MLRLLDHKLVSDTALAAIQERQLLRAIRDLDAAICSVEDVVDSQKLAHALAMLRASRQALVSQLPVDP